MCSFPVLWQLSPAALDFTHQNLYNKIKYYRFCGKEVRSWISPANTASIPCAVQGGYTPGNGEPRQIPIVQSTTFKYDSSDDMGKLFDLQASGYFYSRLQNPTCDTVAAKITELEGGTAGMLTGSGQAANFFALFNICNAGDHIVSSSSIYGGTFNLISVTMAKMGITATFVSPDCTEEELNAAFQPNTKLSLAKPLPTPP